MATTITRQVFLQKFQGKGLDVKKLKNNAQVKAALAQAGQSIDKLLATDTDGDGKIVSGADLAALFRAIDDFDRNGLAQSFITRNDLGRPTLAGVILDSVLAAVEAMTLGQVDSAPAAADFNQRVAKEGKQYVLATINRHRDLCEQRGVGTHYGDHSLFATMSASEQQAYLERCVINGAQVRPAELTKSSCVGWAVECVVAAYVAAGKAARGRAIANAVAANNSMGTVLLRELRNDGWKVLFWAHDANFPDEADGSRQEHIGFVRMATGQKKYWVKYPSETMKVNGYVLNYRPSSDGDTAMDNDAIRKLERIPFAVGVAKGGMHCFAMHDGVVDEEHWDQDPDSEHHFQSTPLRDWVWATGALAVPPGTWLPSS